MPCAIASQMEAKKPRSPGFPVGSKESDFKNNVKTNSKYLDLLITDSELKCKRCVPTGYKCKLKHDNGDIISGQPGIDGQIVDSYIFTDDKTLETGLMPRMIDSVGRVMTNISIDNVLNVKKYDAICRPYKVDINTDEDGKSVPVWCNITDETIKDADFDIHSFKDKDSKNLAINVRDGTVSGFQNMKGNKLNPQNLTFDDDIPMKVYYALLGVGGIYLLYQLSKKYGIKLNLD